MKLNVAVVGTGSMGKNHARIYAELDDVELVAISDVNDSIGKKLAEKYHVPFYKDCDEMIKEEKLDMVSIAVPTNLHFEVASKFINAGISVLIEKPIASKISEAEKMIALAKKKKVILTVGHVERFNPAVIELKKRIDKGEIGEVFKVSASRLSPFPTRIVDMGVIIDLAVHDLDIFKYIVNSEIRTVHAAMERKLHEKHEDICVAILRFKNGVIGVLNLDRLTPVSVRDLTITGSRGMFELNYLNQDLFWHKNSSAEDIRDYTQHVMGVTAGDMVKIRIDKKEPLRVELESFANAVRNKTKPLITGEEALEALKMAHMVLDAAEKNK